MNVTITRTTQHYRRTRNGAWWGNGSTTDAPIVVDETQAYAYILGMGLAGSAEVEWEDGYREFWHYNSSLYIEGPSCSRLRKPEFRRNNSIWWPTSETGQWIEAAA